MDDLDHAIRCWLDRVAQIDNSMLTTTFLHAGDLSVQVKWWSTKKRLLVYDFYCADKSPDATHWRSFTGVCRRLLVDGCAHDIQLVGFVDVDAMDRRHHVWDLQWQLKSLARDNSKERAAILAEIQQLEAPKDGLTATLKGLGWCALSDSEYSLGGPHSQVAHL